MERINDQEFRMIERYKKSEDEDIALYFFNKFNKDLVEIIYYRINKKFSSIPYEKSDLVHLAWKAIKQTMNQIENKESFQGLLIRNCYLSTIKEIRKFLNNSEMVMNITYSFDQNLSKFQSSYCGGVSRIELPRDEIIKNLVEDASNFLEKYKNETIKKVIYLKSCGYSISEIAIKIDVSKHHVKEILERIEKMVRKNYF